MVKITWHFEKRKLLDLRPDPKNPRIIKDKQFKDLEKSIDKFGLAEPITIQPDGLILGGHARFKKLKKDQVKDVDCWVPSRQLTDKERAELNIRLNKNVAGEFDFDILASDFDETELVEFGFERITGTDKDGSDESEEPKSKIKVKRCPHCNEVL